MSWFLSTVCTPAFSYSLWKLSLRLLGVNGSCLIALSVSVLMFTFAFCCPFLRGQRVSNFFLLKLLIFRLISSVCRGQKNLWWHLFSTSYSAFVNWSPFHSHKAASASEAATNTVTWKENRYVIVFLKQSDVHMTTQDIRHRCPEGWWGVGGAFECAGQ